MKTPSQNTTKQIQAGFTIIELMVATLVFSTILVIVTAGVLYFSRTYYASLNRSRVQNSARAIVDAISQGIQFTGTAIATTDDTVNSVTQLTLDPLGDTYFCAGGKVYSFNPGVKYTGATATAANPGLYVAPVVSGCAPLAAGGYNNSQAQQLLGSGMRIANLKVTSVGSQLYSISLTLAYGDDDLISANTGSGVHCLSQAGSQFCAVSALNTTVQRRLQDSQLGH